MFHSCVFLLCQPQHIPRLPKVSTKVIHHNWRRPQLLAIHSELKLSGRLVSSVAQCWKNFTKAASKCVTIYFTRCVTTIPFSSSMNAKGGFKKKKSTSIKKKKSEMTRSFFSRVSNELNSSQHVWLFQLESGHWRQNERRIGENLFKRAGVCIQKY